MADTAARPPFDPTAFGRRGAARAVAADIDAIFGAPPAADPRPSRHVQAIGGLRSGAAGPRAAVIGGALAAALLGVAAGTLITRSMGLEDPRAAPQAAAPKQLEIVRREGFPVSPEPFTPAPMTVPALTAQAPVISAVPAERPRPAAAEKGDCARPGGRTCSYSMVMAADRRLRSAYSRAARAGVSRAELAQYRGRWNRLRRTASDEPDRLVRGYRAMAADLNQLARDRRS